MADERTEPIRLLEIERELAGPGKEAALVMNVIYTNLPDYLHSAREQGCTVIGTTLDGVDIYNAFQSPINSTSSIVQSSIIVMGNEGNGISEAVRAELTTAVRIPTYPANKKASDVVESLNVSIATAIILAQLRRGS